MFSVAPNLAEQMPEIYFYLDSASHCWRALQHLSNNIALDELKKQNILTLTWHEPQLCSYCALSVLCCKEGRGDNLQPPCPYNTAG